jgi:Zn-finger nucleic acid-binding protein
MENYLVQTREDEISYDVCPECGSLWLDAGELDKVAYQVEGSIEFSSREEPEEGESPSINCPRCGKVEMESVRFLGHSDIFLDHCPSCEGFWLNSDELDRINRELEEIMPVEGTGFTDFIKNVHIPYWHKRIRRSSPPAETGGEILPVQSAQLIEGTPLVCPACTARLNRYKAYGMVFEGCPDCRGIWLSQKGLKKLKDRAGSHEGVSLRWLDDEVESIDRSQAIVSGRECPACEGQHLLSTSFGDSRVVVDWCPSCRNIWLDGGEFRRIVSFLREKLADLSPEELRGLVGKEIKEILSGPEGKISELLDASAALRALLSLGIYRHPRLCEMLLQFSERLESSGI